MRRPSSAQSAARQADVRPRDHAARDYGDTEAILTSRNKIAGVVMKGRRLAESIFSSTASPASGYGDRASRGKGTSLFANLRFARWTFRKGDAAEIVATKQP